MEVWLIVLGDGSDGDEHHVEGVYSTPDKARAALAAAGLYEDNRTAIEKWIVDEPLFWAAKPAHAQES